MVEDWRVLKGILASGKMKKSLLFISVLSAVSLGAFPIVWAEILGVLVNQAVAGRSLVIMLSSALLLFITGGLKAFAQFIAASTQGRLVGTVTADLRSNVYAAVVSMPLEDLDRFKDGEVLKTFTVNLARIESFFNLLFRTLLLLFSAVFSFVYISLINYWISAIVIVVLLFTMILSRKIGDRMSLQGGRQDQAAVQASAYLEDLLKGTEDIQSFVAEDIFLEKYSHALQEEIKEHSNIQFENYRLLALTGLLRQVPRYAIIIVGALFVIAHRLSIGQLVSVYMVVNSVILGLPNIASSLPRIRAYFTPLQRIHTILSLLKEDQYQSYESEQAPDQVGCSDAIVSVENVCYGYVDRDYSLQYIDLEIRPGQRVALIGKSGSGKSTILKLICGLYAPQQGRVRVHGKDPKEMRHHIGFLPQHPLLFPGSLRENVVLGAHDPAEEAVQNLMKRMFSSDEHQRFLQGLETGVEEGGRSISGGQRQRIAIARTILRRSSVLLLDEPTSSVDSVSETEIYTLLEEYAPRAAILVATHRLHTVMAFDEIIVIQDGRIVERGTHEFLMNLGGQYLQMYNSGLGVGSE